jgi:hypothetical protein
VNRWAVCGPIQAQRRPGPRPLQDALGRLERIQDLHERLTSEHDETDADDS